MRDLKTLKGLLKDFELGGDDFDAKIVWVPSKPENQNDEKAMKEWKCKSNVAIFSHMQLLKDKGLTNVEFVVKETEKDSLLRELSSKRKRCGPPNSVVSTRLKDLSNCSRLPSSSGRSSEELDRVEVEVPVQIRVIPTEFKNKILQLGGSEGSITFVLRKALTETDVNGHQSRFSVPLGQIENEFLTTEEKGIIVSNNVESTFIEPDCDVHCMLNVQKWKSTAAYQLVKPWNDVVIRNGLKAKMMVELWTFRIGSQLGLALILVE